MCVKLLLQGGEAGRHAPGELRGSQILLPCSYACRGTFSKAFSALLYDRLDNVGRLAQTGFNRVNTLSDAMDSYEERIRF
jgi:hypothetical protein